MLFGRVTRIFKAVVSVYSGYFELDVLMIMLIAMARVIVGIGVGLDIEVQSSRASE